MEHSVEDLTEAGRALMCLLPRERIGEINGVIIFRYRLPGFGERFLTEVILVHEGILGLDPFAYLVLRDDAGEIVPGSLFENEPAALRAERFFS